MKNLIIGILFGGVMMCCYGCKTTPTKNQETPNEPKTEEAPQKSTPIGGDQEASVLEVVDAKELNELLSRYKHIERYLSIMDSDEGRLEYLERLREMPEVPNEANELYNRLTEMSNEDNHYMFSEARWRLVHLMGDLKGEEVSNHLYDIATSDLPNPERVKESTFKAEYRIRLRAIAGLQKLEGVEFLQKIHRQNGLLSGAAAAGLYELGKAPDTVIKLDEKKVIGQGNPEDFKENPDYVIKDGFERIPENSNASDTSKVITPNSKTDGNE